MSKYEWKELTTSQRVLFILYVLFTYIASTGVVLWSFVIEKLTEETSIFAKIGCIGILTLVLIVVIAFKVINNSINRKLEYNTTKSQELLKEIIIKTDETIKQQKTNELTNINNYSIKIKCSRNIMKNINIVVISAILTILFYFAEKTSIKMRGIFFGLTLCLSVGLIIHIIYENSVKKSKMK